jgi:hypothetical protein
MEMLTLIGILVLVVDALVVVQVLASSRPWPVKLMWIAIALALPFVGAVFFFALADIRGLPSGDRDGT